jgi:HD superfamily phosphodiesterase
MEYITGKLTKVMADYFEDDYRRIEHAIDVLMHTEIIADSCLDELEFDEEILIASALLHDVGIKKSEAELGYNNGITQENYGPPIAKELLEQCGFPEEKIEMVCKIIGNHHTKSKFESAELELLKAADQIVNKMEA